LELVKMNEIVLEQQAQFGDIWAALAPVHPI
jgi:hypothetical protein